MSFTFSWPAGGCGLAAMATLLAACATPPAPQATAPQAPPPVIQLHPTIQKLYVDYQQQPLGALFFASLDGRQGIYFFCPDHPCDEVREAELKGRCHASGISDCIPYARGRQILVRTQ